MGRTGEWQYPAGANHDRVYARGFLSSPQHCRHGHRLRAVAEDDSAPRARFASIQLVHGSQRRAAHGRRPRGDHAGVLGGPQSQRGPRPGLRRPARGAALAHGGVAVLLEDPVPGGVHCRLRTGDLPQLGPALPLPGEAASGVGSRREGLAEGRRCLLASPPARAAMAVWRGRGPCLRAGGARGLLDTPRAVQLLGRGPR
mmetsp:Transcript_82277/g.241545  ORF Transcript_82277/g.241545 Transcript_82277/m.241545 type:complete len:200 (-) Transcript_82277:434-1033(-)